MRRARDADEIAPAVRALVGLGPGLTPAGDDALIGWLAGMALLPSEPVRDRLLRAAQCAIVGCLSRTTDVSRAHLEDALEGQFSQSLSGFANALAEGRPALHDALRELARLGASSGLDAAASLLAALSASSAHAGSVVDVQVPNRTAATEDTERFQSITSSTQLTRALGRESHSIDSFSVSSVSSAARFCFPG